MAEIPASRCILTTNNIVTFNCGLGYGADPRSTERIFFIRTYTILSSCLFLGLLRKNVDIFYSESVVQTTVLHTYQ